MSNRPVVCLDDAQTVREKAVVLVDRNDGFHVRDGLCAVAGCSVADARPSNTKSLGHSDAVQFIVAGDRRDWFTAGMLSGGQVVDCRFESDGMLQGVTAWDGLYRGISVTGNYFDLVSPHKIAFNGLLSGTFGGNVDADGNPITVTANPLRIGGRRSGRNVWVIGFKQGVGQLGYEPIVSSDPLIDRREIVFNDDDTFLTDFDWLGYRDAVADVFDVDIDKHMTAVKALALQFGVLASAGDVAPENNKQKQQQNKSNAGVLVMNKSDVFDPLSELGLMQATEVPVSILFNNPLAVKDFGDDWRHKLAKEDWPDFMKGRRNDLLRFDHPSWGIRCGLHILLKYQTKYGLTTIRQMISKWSPCHGRGADNSCASTEAYIEHVANRVGVSDKAVVAVRDYETARRMLEGMIEIESGSRIMPYSLDVLDEGLALAGIKMPEESQVEVKPGSTSSERTGAVLVGTGGVGAVVSKVLVESGLTGDQAAAVIDAVGDAAAKVDVTAATVDWVFWLSVLNSVCLVAIVGGGIWLWRGRHLAGRLLLR